MKYISLSKQPQYVTMRMESDFDALLEMIGALLARDTAYPIDGTFLYVEGDWGMIDVSIFKDLGDHLLFRISDDELDAALHELWDAADPGKRWATMQYRIQDGQFTASFTYPDQVDPDERSMDRRDRILQERYGNKRVVYPSLK